MSEAQDSTTAPTTWDCFAAAVRLLTRIPIAEPSQLTADSYRTAMLRGVVFFPLIGGGIGILTSVILCLACVAGLPPFVAALLAVGLEVMLTGAFHEDAFADTCDALGGGWTRDQTLEIMKDSRLGTYGTLGLIIGVGLRVTASASLLSSGLLWTCASTVAASALARLAIVGMMATTKPVDDRPSIAKDISGGHIRRTFVLSTLLSLPLIVTWVWINSLTAAVGILISIVVLAWFRHLCLCRVRGTTGDLLGCSAYLVQLVVIVASTGTVPHV